MNYALNPMRNSSAKQSQIGQSVNIKLSSGNMKLSPPLFYFLSLQDGSGLGGCFHYAAHEDVVAGEGADIRIVAGLTGRGEFDDGFFSVVD